MFQILWIAVVLSGKMSSLKTRYPALYLGGYLFPFGTSSLLDTRSSDAFDGGSLQHAVYTNILILHILPSTAACEVMIPILVLCSNRCPISVPVGPLHLQCYAICQLRTHIHLLPLQVGFSVLSLLSYFTPSVFSTFSFWPLLSRSELLLEKLKH